MLNPVNLTLIINVCVVEAINQGVPGMRDRIECLLEVWPGKIQISISNCTPDHLALREPETSM